MEKGFAWGAIPVRRQRLQLAQAELKASERALAQQLERVAILVAVEEETIAALRHVLAGNRVALADVREQRQGLARARAMLQEARATASELRRQMAECRLAALAAQRDVPAPRV